MERSNYSCIIGIPKEQNQDHKVEKMFQSDDQDSFPEIKGTKPSSFIRRTIKK